MTSEKRRYLGDCGTRFHNIQEATISDLEFLHEILFGNKGRPNLIRKRIREFQGFQFAGDDDLKEKVNLTSKMFSEMQLLKTCEILCLETELNDTTKDLSAKIVKCLNDFPQMENKSQESVKVAEKQKGAASLLRLELEAKKDIQVVSTKLAELNREYFEGAKRVLNLKADLRKLKKPIPDTEVDSDKIQEVEDQLEQAEIEQNLKKVDLDALRDKKEVLMLELDCKRAEYVAEDQPTTQNGEADQIEQQSGNSRVENWLDNVESDKLEVKSNASSKNQQNDGDNLTITVQRLLARQTIGGKLPDFDGTSCLKWQSFLAEYNMSNETCGFKPKENVLRLEKHLKGQAYKDVEWLLMAAREPDAIITTLSNKYGRPELLLDELLCKARAVTKVSDWKSFVDFNCAVQNVSAAVDQIGGTSLLDMPNLVATLINKLPEHFVIQWGKYLMEKTIPYRKATLQDLSKWTAEMADIVSEVTFVSKKHGVEMFAENKGDSPTDEVESRKKYTKGDSSDKNCKVCHQGEHILEKCTKFLAADAKKRWDMAQKVKVCFCCLKKHVDKCQNRKQCNKCERFHHSLLHKEKSQVVASIQHGNLNIDPTVVLKIVPIRIKGPKGVISTSAYLDEGSGISLIDSEIANAIGLEGPISSLCYKWTNGIYHHEPNAMSVVAEIAGANKDLPFYSVTGLRTVKDLQLPEQAAIPNRESMLELYPHLRKADLNNFQSLKPTILLGQPQAYLIVGRRTIGPRIDGPILSKTKLGWTLHGPVGKHPANGSTSKCVFACCESGDELHEAVKDYFRLENFGATIVKIDRTKSLEDRKAIEVAEKTIKRVGNGYEVGLPWRDNFSMPDSKQMAVQRLLCLERKLRKDENLTRAYQNEIEKLFARGYAKEVSEEEIRNAAKVWYLPHFAVLNPNKPNKVRVVFDAAAQVNDISLNKMLLTGPNLTTSQPGILIRFRKHPIAFAADIKEYFNQVTIKQDDSFAQLFFWRDLDSGRAPRVFRMSAMVFGLASAPFLAQYVKIHNAERFSDTRGETVRRIKENEYVDDHVDGENDVESCIALIKDIVFIHRQAGFEIRNFVSNSKEVLQNIPQDLLAGDVTQLFDQDELNEQRLLGLEWNTSQDTIGFNLKFNKISGDLIDGTRCPTKREVLGVAMSVYDPIGLLSPVLVKSRILLQEIWMSGIGWNDQISNIMFDQWKRWIAELRELKNLRIPRQYSSRQGSKYLELVTFTDASEEAYACAVYLRFTYEDGIEVRLVTSKARVAPIKKTTIPKLELLAAVLGCRMAKVAKDELQLEISRSYYFTDSKTVLQWLNTKKKLPNFTANRVGEILETSEASEWRWVPSAENVADESTRSKPTENFTDTGRWFTGPKFLYAEQDTWPKLCRGLTDEQNSEAECLPVCSVTEYITPLPRIRSFYTWNKVRRIVAWMLRFIQNAKIRMTEGERRVTGELTDEELDNAANSICKVVQKEDFSIDFKNLNKEGRNSKQRGRLENLNAFIDKEGLIRLEGRLTKADCVETRTKAPIVLDGKNEYVKLLILHEHAKANHQGLNLVVNELRRDYWILKARSAVKRAFRDCYYCGRRKAKALNPMMSTLPRERFFYYRKPFTAAGVDYFGPMYVKIGRSTHKRYGVLFTCLSTRAVHVEVAHSLTTDSCILAIQRFVARRGAVERLYSDNGTNLVGASRELQDEFEKMHEAEINIKMAAKGITWRFIPPASPHMGGTWERLIGVFKRTIEPVLRGADLNDEQLLTIINEAEAIVNNRPITILSDDPTDPVGLCPSDILIGKSTEIRAPGLFDEQEKYRRKQWRAAEYLVDLFWHRWLKEYIPYLLNRQKWTASTENLKVGDTVVVADNNLPRGVWPLGIVESVRPGSDGVVRMAEVRLANGSLWRPAHKLHRLVIAADNKESAPGGGMSNAV